MEGENPMKVLVVGDRIVDQYSFGKVSRVCPEGPAPVLVVTAEKTSNGGAALVSDNLVSLMGRDNVISSYGSTGTKHRFYSGHTLLMRLDCDRQSVANPSGYWSEILRRAPSVDAIVVGDYGKGAISDSIASGLLGLQSGRCPLFVDAKDGIEKYKGCFAVFPNEDEHPTLNPKDYQHVIRKLGPKGCSVDGVVIPTEEQQVYDVTGAGDVFLAAFVWRYLTGPSDVSLSKVDRLVDAAVMGNKAGGISVRHLGTYIVRPEELI